MMKTRSHTRRMPLVRLAYLAIAASLSVLAACGPSKSSVSAAAPVAPVPAALAAAMVPQAGEAAPDKEIRRCQEKVRAGFKREAWIERLGWAFVNKARESFDPGYYKLAEICALALEADAPGSAESMLLRGHVLDSLHRFKDAEPLARRLVALRGLSYDYALLGDVLMEQGRIQESIPVYQKAMDLRPDLHSYARASYIRWLTGDLDGSISLMRSAVGASSPMDPASIAWTCSRLATLDFQAGNAKSAQKDCDTALASLAAYPPALLLQGRMRLAAQDPQAAVAPLEAAAKANPLPEPQWVLADALRAAGREADAAKVESLLQSRGAVADPRTLSLFLATRGREVDLAVRLAQEELRQRQDVFTRDALAWALAAAGRLPEALDQMDLALGEGTQDARLFFHAAYIAARSGDAEAAREWISRAGELKQMLYPSEREQLDRLDQSLGSPGARPASATPGGPQFPVSEFIEGGISNPKSKGKS